MSDQSRGAPRVAVVTCLRDEGPFITEWVAHLRGLGVSRILAFSNDCTDGTEAVLDALSPAGVVHVPQGTVRGLAGPTPQWRALRQAWDHPALDGFDWLLHLDVDEFIALNGPRTLAELIANCGAAQAIALPWRLFGCDGRLTPGQGITPERFSRCAPVDMVFPALGSFFKTLFHRDGPFTGFGVHRPAQSAPPAFADCTGALSTDLAESPARILHPPRQVSGGLVQLNHYSTRSIHEFLAKRLRGLPNRTDKAIDLTYWIERNFNQVPCDMIAPQLPELHATLADLRALPGVATAEARARDWHATQLETVLASAEGAHLCGRLVLAGGSIAPDPRLGRALLRQAQLAGRDAT
ncbi:glycosyltransferase family 2 protein [Jannaschia sp. 2305UL9-9]|uniref:glycosyltransferase family 2 protein n=1 Tax=Jannaschia sp. 2305UL9-9 TaxID=3121638 RepID=UPI0035297AB8